MHSIRYAILSALIFAVTTDGLHGQGQPGQPPIPNAPAAPPANPLPKRDLQRLDQLLGELTAGRLGGAHQILQPLIESWTPMALEHGQRYLQQRGVDEAMETLLLESRLQLVLEGQGRRLRRPKEKELALLLPFLSKRAGEMMAPANEELAVGLPAAMPHEVIDERLELLPSLMTQVDHARSVYEHLQLCVGRLRPADVQNLPEDAKPLAEHDWKAEAEFIAPVTDQLVERLIDLAVLQVRDMVAILGNRSARYQDRFKAAQRLRKSLALIDTHWKRYEQRSERDPAARSPAQVNREIQQLRAAGQRVGGELERRAFLLEEGTRWWLRGRFGRGPLDGGLAKAMPVGARNLDQAMLYYPLRLPRPIPVAPDPLKNPLRVPVPRRHIEYWIAESSVPFLSGWQSNFVVDQADPELPKAALNPQEYRQLLNRLDFHEASVGYVGYLEYQMALFYFDALVNLCSRAELEALEDTIAEDGRLAVHSNLSRQYEPLAGNASLTFNFVKTVDPRASGDYERRGLSWMMALARLELGAMAAARIPPLRRPTVVTQPVDAPPPPGGRPFMNLAPVGRGAAQARQVGNVAGRAGNPAARGLAQYVVRPVIPRIEPFALFSPSGFEADAYVELLFDGARQHYFSLRTEFQFRTTQRQNEAFLERLLVRLAVADEMLNALRAIAGARLTRAQQMEMRAWQQWIEQTRVMIEEYVLLAPAAYGRGEQPIR